MPLHSDPIVDRAMRANIGAGFHFFTNAKFHKSKSVCGFLSQRERYAYVVERYRTVTMGGVTVQTPHSRVIRVDLENGETEYLTKEGLLISEYVDGKYVNRGEAFHYRDNGVAKIYAAQFAAREVK